jgi:mannose-6-phosphate isomerase-like protein (cupin superfamily)
METRSLDEMYVPPDEGTNLWFLGQLVTFKIHSPSALVGVFQLITPPQGGIPPHRHAAQDETHYVLRGQYEFRCANHRLHAEPSAVVHVPAGMVHGFRNVGAEPGELLCIVTPSGPLERFLEAVGEPITDPAALPELALEIKRLGSVAERIGGIEFVGQIPNGGIDKEGSTDNGAMNSA